MLNETQINKNIIKNLNQYVYILKNITAWRRYVHA